MDKNIQNAILETLKNLQKLITNSNGFGGRKNEYGSETDILVDDDRRLATNYDDVIDLEGIQPKIKNEAKNAQNQKKVYKKLAKEEKDIYNCINSVGERIGTFYGTKPIEVAKKVANRMYKENEKEFFDVKIYNRMTDRLYSYKAQIIPCERVKKIKNMKIPITHNIKLVRI